MSMDSEESRGRAAERRGRITIRRSTLGGSDRDPDPVRGADALTLVTRLTREGWSLSGLPVPDYDRSETPYRFVRGSLQ